MAKAVGTFPPRRGRPQKYPWRRWLNGRVWRLKPGVDFKCDTHALRSAGYAACRKRGLKLRVVRKDGFFFIQAITKEKS